MKIKFDEVDIDFFKKHNEFKQFPVLEEIKPNTIIEIEDELVDDIRDVCLNLEVSLLGKDYTSNEESLISTSLADRLFTD